MLHRHTYFNCQLKLPGVRHPPPLPPTPMKGIEPTVSDRIRQSTKTPPGEKLRGVQDSNGSTSRCAESLEQSILMANAAKATRAAAHSLLTLCRSEGVSETLQDALLQVVLGL